MREFKGSPSAPEKLGIIDVEQGDVIRRCYQVIPEHQDGFANINIGKLMYVEKVSSGRRAEVRVIEAEEEQANWGVRVSIPERHLLPQYYEKLSDDEIPEPIKKLIESEQKRP